MTDYSNMSIGEMWARFDLNHDGIIDKKEAKKSKKMYDGVFSIKEGMDINAFKLENKSIWEDKNIHSTILNKANECRKLYDNMNDNGSFIRTSATYFSLLDKKIKFEDLKPYLEKSDHIENLQNAFKLLDKIDSYQEVANGKFENDFKEDGFFDTSNLEPYKGLDLLFFPARDGNLTNRKNIERLIEYHNIDCTAEDVETILLALCLKRTQEQKNNK